MPSFWADIERQTDWLKKTDPTLSINPANGNSNIASTPAANVGWVYIVSEQHVTFKAMVTTGIGLFTY